MNIVILVDKNSTASQNIKDKLLNNFKHFQNTGQKFEDNEIFLYSPNDEINSYLITSNTRSVEAENIDKEIQNKLKIVPDLIIYATTHTSKSKIPSFSVHSIGNWDKAELGGKDNTLVISAENFLKDSLKYMQTNFQKYDSIKGFDIVQEVTHHGPIASCPFMFIEIGSSEDEWNKNEAGIFIAETILYLINNAIDIESKTYKTAFGIGGQHTASNFKKIMINDEEYTVGHICPKYMIESLNEEMIIQGMKKSTKASKIAILDWKGIGAEKQRIVAILEKHNIPHKKTKEFKYES